MVIIKVSRSKEKAILNTVRTLRRLLRNAFFVMNRLKVMVKPRGRRGVRTVEQPSPCSD